MFPGLGKLGVNYWAPRLLPAIWCTHQVCAGLEKEMLVFTCSCFHLGKLRKRDNLWLIIFQVSACIKVRTLFTACGPYVLAGSWKDKVDTHQTLPPQHVPVCSVTQSCL